MTAKDVDIPSVNSPILCLPTELLIELFTHCCSNDTVAPLKLASVSHRFREVVFSSPRVWQLISLNDHRFTVSASHIQAKLWLARSDPLPFNVELELQNPDALLSLLSPFMSSIDRWRYCWIRGAIEERLNISCLFQTDLVPVLHYLNIAIESVEEAADPSHRSPTLYSCGAYSQTLQHLSMNVSVATLPPANLLTPMQFTTLNVTELSLEVYLQPTQLLDFLIMCPRLEKIYFSGGLHDEVVEEKLQVVHLPHLRILVIRNTCFQRTILSALDAPVLKELHLQNLNLDFELRHNSTIEDGDSDEEDPDYSRSPWSDHHTGMGLRKLITRSNPPLEVLDMDLSDMRSKDFIWCFERLSNLRRFSIFGSDMSNRIINLLKPVFFPPSGDVVSPRAPKLRMPRLSALELYSCQQLGGEAVVDAIGSRVKYTDAMTPDSTFENFTIVDCTDFLPHHSEKLLEHLGRRLHVI